MLIMFRNFIVFKFKSKDNKLCQTFVEIKQGRIKEFLNDEIGVAK